MLTFFKKFFCLNLFKISEVKGIPRFYVFYSELATREWCIWPFKRTHSCKLWCEERIVTTMFGCTSPAAPAVWSTSVTHVGLKLLPRVTLAPRNSSWSLQERWREMERYRGRDKGFLHFLTSLTAWIHPAIWLLLAPLPLLVQRGFPLF